MPSTRSGSDSKENSVSPPNVRQNKTSNQRLNRQDKKEGKPDKNKKKDSVKTETAKQSSNSIITKIKEINEDNDDDIQEISIESKQSASKEMKNIELSPKLQRAKGNKRKNGKQIPKSTMDKYFGEDEDSITEYDESSDTDIEKKLTNKEKAIAIIHDPMVLKMKEDLMAICDAPDLAQVRTKVVIQAMRAIGYIKAIQKRTRLPPIVCREMDKAMEVITNSLIELESRIHHAEAKVEVLEAQQMPNQIYKDREKEQTNDSEAVQTIPKEIASRKRTPRSFAEAVKNATSTIIVQAKDTGDSEEVKRQIEGKATMGYEKVHKVIRIRNGLKIECENAEAAEELKKTLIENEDTSAALNIRSANLRRKIIIIFSISNNVNTDFVNNKINKVLGIEGTNIRENVITLLKPIKSGNETYHLPITLPEPLANVLLSNKTICLGLRECPIRNYVTIQRCYKCLGFDHVAAECSTAQRCSKCAGEHEYKNCNSNKKRCRICWLHNSWNHERLTAPKPEDHEAYSGNCQIYRTLLTIRQLEMEQGRRRLTVGMDVARGNITIIKQGGIPRISVPQRNQDNSNEQQRSRRTNRR